MMLIRPGDPKAVVAKQPGDGARVLCFLSAGVLVGRPG